MGARPLNVRSSRRAPLGDYTAISLLVLTLFFWADANAQTARFVPGEVLAKFSPGSPENQAVEAAANSGRDPSEPIPSVCKRLRADVPVPIRFKRIQSGNWATFDVDAQELKRTLEQAFSQDERVADIESAELGPRPPTGYLTSPLLLIRLERSSSFRDDAAATVRDIQKRLGTPLTFEMRKGARVAVAVDVQKLTLNLIELFKALPYVENAQANQIASFR